MEKIDGQKINLSISEADKNELIKCFDKLFTYQNYAHVNSLQRLSALFPSIYKIFIEKLAPFLKVNPGILQKNFYENKEEKQKWSFVFYSLEKLCFIKRKNTGALMNYLSQTI